MKIRVISDLHVDVNRTQYFGFMDNPENVDLNIICGDVAGDYIREEDFLKTLDIPTICICGNHLGYNYDSIQKVNLYMGIGQRDVRDCTKEDCIKKLTKMDFSNGNVTYLENEYLSFGDYIIFGGCMYSDFRLYGNKHKENCKITALRWLNDFRYVYTYDKNKKLVRPIDPKDYCTWYNRFMRKLKKCIEENQDKKIIVVTHFAPSIKSIDSKYLNKPNRFSSPGSELNAVYANNLEQFIMDNPQIKYWFHGHVHSCFDYNIGNCRVVCNPFGYKHENKIKTTHYLGKVLEI